MVRRTYLRGAANIFEIGTWGPAIVSGPLIVRGYTACKMEIFVKRVNPLDNIYVPSIYVRRPEKRCLRESWMHLSKAQFKFDFMIKSGSRRI